MEIPDLHSFPPDHPPSPYPSPVVIDFAVGEYYRFVKLPTGLTLTAVGWLGQHVPTRGQVTNNCIDRLVEAFETQRTISDGTMGCHDCEICTTTKRWWRRRAKSEPVVRWRGQKLRLLGHGHHLIRLGSTVYMSPALILHYILDHEYRPPSEFMRAVIEGTFLTVDDLDSSRVTFDEFCTILRQLEPQDEEAS